MLKEVRLFEQGKVYELCNREQFYTRGDAAQYDRMLSFVSANRYNGLDINVVIAVAADIASHSDYEKWTSEFGEDYHSFENHIVYLLLNNCMESQIVEVE